MRPTSSGSRTIRSASTHGVLAEHFWVGVCSSSVNFAPESLELRILAHKLTRRSSGCGTLPTAGALVRP
jgi:hypothetical protein